MDKAASWPITIIATLPNSTTEQRAYTQEQVANFGPKKRALLEIVKRISTCTKSVEGGGVVYRVTLTSPQVQQVRDAMQEADAEAVA